MIDEATKGWVAGILDFQAHVQIRKNHQRAAGSEQITIYVSTSIAGIPERLCELTGTSPEEKANHRLKPEWTRRRCTEHCPEAHDHVTADEMNMPLVTKWSCTGAAAAIILWNVRRYMTTDHEPWDWAQAQVLSQLRLTGQGSAAIIGAAKRLHSLGWELPPVLAGVIPKALPAAG